MPEFLVRWEVNVFDVETPREAAEEALRMQRDPESIATVFDVLAEDDAVTRIDLTFGPAGGVEG